jgi:hypothetical protein
MGFIKFQTLSEAKSTNERITNDCINSSIWTDGITNNYCNPYYDPLVQAWIIPILEGYEKYFTDSELEQAALNQYL